MITFTLLCVHCSLKRPVVNCDYIFLVHIFINSRFNNCFSLAFFIYYYLFHLICMSVFFVFVWVFASCSSKLGYPENLFSGNPLSRAFCPSPVWTISTPNSWKLLEFLLYHWYSEISWWCVDICVSIVLDTW